MEYKYPSEEKFAPCVDEEDREDAPHRAVGMLHSGPGQQTHFQKQMDDNSFYANFGAFGMDSKGLGMPSFEKSSFGNKTMEKSQSRYNIENFCDARSESKPLSEHYKEMKIRDLSSPYVKSQAIVLVEPAGLTFEEQYEYYVRETYEYYVRETFKIIHDILRAMAPDVTVQPNTKDLKCKGSFTRDFCTVHFDAAVWRVKSQDGKGDVYIYEFRRKSISGRDAFEYLIRKVGAELKDKGRAKMYGNGVEIFPPMEIEMPEDLGDLAMPSFGGMGSHTSIPKEKCDRGFPISLGKDDEHMNRMCKTIDDRQWPIYEENMRLFARCCCNSENVRVMAEHASLQKVLIKELKLGSDSTNTHNILTILYAILESASSEKIDVEEGILYAVAEALRTCLGLNQKKGESKVVKSVALERAALKVLLLLSEEPNHFNQKQVHEVLPMLEEASKKMKDGLNYEHLGYVMENLKGENSVN